jgi:hypothetical protein
VYVCKLHQQLFEEGNLVDLGGKQWELLWDIARALDWRSEEAGARISPTTTPLVKQVSASQVFAPILCGMFAFGQTRSRCGACCSFAQNPWGKRPSSLEVPRASNPEPEESGATLRMSTLERQASDAPPRTPTAPKLKQPVYHEYYFGDEAPKGIQCSNAECRALLGANARFCANCATPALQATPSKGLALGEKRLKINFGKVLGKSDRSKVYEGLYMVAGREFPVAVKVLKGALLWGL